MYFPNNYFPIMVISPLDRRSKIIVKTKTKKLHMPNHQISVNRKGFSKQFKHCPPIQTSKIKNRWLKWENPEKEEHAIEKTNYTSLKTLTTSAGNLDEGTEWWTGILGLLRWANPATALL